MCVCVVGICDTVVVSLVTDKASLSSYVYVVLILIHFQGTMDQCNYLAAEAALDFYEEIGGLEAISGHVVPLLEWAQEMIAEALGTEKLRVPKSMEAPFMKLVGECSKNQITCCSHLTHPPVCLSHTFTVSVLIHTPAWFLHMS